MLLKLLGRVDEAAGTLPVKGSPFSDKSFQSCNVGCSAWPEDVDANLLESDGCKRRREGTTVIAPEPKRVKRSSDDLVADVCSALRHVELQQMWAASLRCFLLATAPMVLQTSQEGRSEQDMSFFRLLDEIFQAEWRCYKRNNFFRCSGARETTSFDAVTLTGARETTSFRCSGLRRHNASRPSMTTRATKATKIALQWLNHVLGSAWNGSATSD